MSAAAAPRILIKAIAGSQYVAKVITGLDSIGVPYFVEILDPLKLSKLLPAPHKVPVMHIGEGDDVKIVPDSADIFAHIDEHLGHAQKFYPTEEARTLDAQIGDNFNEMVVYFNWVSDEGFERSIKVKVAEKIPSFVRCLITPERVLRKNRESIRARIEAKFPDVKDDDSALAKLREEIAGLEARFADDEQRYILATEHPTAPDFMLYGSMQHLVSNSGDAKLPPCLPNLFADVPAPRIQRWFAHMEETFPIKFLGKRPEDAKK
jgi:glutathione S-transferase